MKITIDQIPQDISIKSITIDLDIDKSNVKVNYQPTINTDFNNEVKQHEDQQIRKQLPVPPEMNMQF